MRVHGRLLLIEKNHQIVTLSCHFYQPYYTVQPIFLRVKLVLVKIPSHPHSRNNYFRFLLILKAINANEPEKTA